MSPALADLLSQNIALIVLAVVILFTISSAVRIVPQSEKYVVERFGRLRALLGPGINFKAKRILAEAEAFATTAIAEAIAKGGLEAAQYQVAMKQVETLATIGQGSGKQTLVLSANAVDALGDASRMLRGAVK